MNTSKLDREKTVKAFLAHLDAGHKDEANRLLERTIRSAPQEAGIYSLLIGGVLAQNGQYADAIPLYKMAIQLETNEPLGYFYLGTVYHALDMTTECNEIWDELAKRFPDSPADYYQQGLRCLRENKFVDAKERVEKAIACIDEGNALIKDILKTLDVINQHLM